ncbi:MAG: hypothetical protein PWQ97_131 [Tepidanaerobacteraceae bacterium]|nr:hypothetical protein [Tepidanaerobacteraceae bacterium]
MSKKNGKKNPQNKARSNPYTLFLILILLINSTESTCIFKNKKLFNSRRVENENPDTGRR